MAPSTLIDRIDKAFDRAVGYEGNAEGRDASGSGRRRTRKGKARAVVPDDEEDQEAEMEAVPIVDPQGGGTSMGGSGGFVPEQSAEQSADQSAEQSFPRPEGGGFLAQDPPLAGGFFADAQMDDPTPSASFGGGFLPMEVESTGNGASAVGSGGGFFPAEPFSSFSMDPSTSLASGSGGFFPLAENDDATYSGNPGTSLGGFLPQLPDLDFGGIDSLTLPTPPRPSRIPFSRITRALRDLKVPRGSEKEVLEMFEEVASDDENAEGGKSVRRERFIEALEVLLDEQEDSEGPNGRDDDSEEYNDRESEAETSKRATHQKPVTRATRRSTRANPVAELETPGDDLKETDFVELSSESEDSADLSSGDDEANVSSTKKKSKTRTSAKSKSKKHKYNPRSRISEDKLAAASDSFDLFFEGSAQSSLPQQFRKIGLAELQRACRVLKEKFSDEDLTEMLEFAAEGSNLVDLESFARILVETRL